MNVEELKQQRATLISQARGILNAADSEQRGLTDDERAAYDALAKKIDSMDAEIDVRKRQEALERDLDALEQRRSAQDPAIGAPALLRIPRGDNETRALAHYIRTGDARALGETRASNDTDMNIVTGADGGYAVPTGHYQGIIAKRDESMLANMLNVLRVPGRGTTVDVPFDNGTANVFVSTAEAAAFDRDAPAIGKVSMTLVKYTKKIQMSLELLRDEDSRLLDFLTDYVGRAMALTHNSLLCTEVAANGTAVTLAAASAATAGDIQTLVYSLKAEYADNAAWLMRRATEGAYRKLAGSDWQYAPAFNNTLNTINGGRGQFWGFPVYNTESISAIGANAKSIVFGNFAFVGMREGDGFTFLRDPYGSAATGQINLYYYFDVVYKVLVPEAIRCGTHPAL